MFKGTTTTFGQSGYLFFLKTNLTFKPHTNSEGKLGFGVFEINRLLHKKAAFFPSGYTGVLKNFLRLSKKVESQPETVKFANHRLEAEYRKGWYKKYTPQELEHDLKELKIQPPDGIYLDLHAVYNTKSSSTPYRLLVDPARVRNLLESKGSKCSYNDLVSIPKYGLISPYTFSLKQILYSQIVGMDISTAFRTIRHSRETMLHNLTIFYEGENGQPLLTSEGAKVVNGKPVLTTYAFAHLLFGIKDSPALLGLSLSKAVEVWRLHEVKLEQDRYGENIVLKVENLLSVPYVDDLLLGAVPWEVVHNVLLQCKKCIWCKSCTNITLNTNKEKEHNMLCPLYSEVKDETEHEKVKGKLTCGCFICQDCNFWQIWVRPGPTGVIHFRSERDYQKYLMWFNEQYLNFLGVVLELLLKVLAFCGFRTKGIETQFSYLQNVYDKYNPPSDTTVGCLWSPPPDVKVVLEESSQLTLDKNSRKKTWRESDDVPEELRVICDQKIEEFQNEDITPTSVEEEKVFMTQMARKIFSKPNVPYSDRMTCRSGYLEFEGIRMYKNSGPLCTFSDFVSYIKSNGWVITRRFVAAVTGLLFDVGHLTSNLVVALIFAKRAHHHLYILPGSNVTMYGEDDQDTSSEDQNTSSQEKAKMPGWDEPVPKVARVLIFKAAQAFYLLKNRLVLRNSLIQHCATGRLLMACSDSGIELASERVFLVTWCYINGSYRAQSQCLFNSVLVNRPDVFSMPVKEGIALYKLVLSLADILKVLDDMGLAVPPDHVSIVTDSHTTLILLRSISSYGIFQNKLKHLAAKTYAVLISLNLNVMKCLYSFYQDNSEGILFPPDLLTKIDEKSSVASILKRADSIQHLPWLSRHPSTWPISRQIRESSANSFIGADLLIDPSYVKRLEQEVRYQQAVCVGKVGEPLQQQKNSGFGLEVLSKQQRQKTGVALDNHSMRKLYWEREITKRFSNIIYEDQHSRQFRKVCLVGVYSRVLYYIARLRLGARMKREKLYYTTRAQAFKRCQDVTKSPWCGFLWCFDPDRCRHQDSNFGGRLSENEDFKSNRRLSALPHYIHREHRLWGFNNKTSDFLFSHPFPDTSRQSRESPQKNNEEYGELAALHRNIWCTDTTCCLCATKKEFGVIHQLLDYVKTAMPEPADGILHWQWSLSSSLLVAHFDWHPLFRNILAERILNILAGTFPAEEDMIWGLEFQGFNLFGGFRFQVAVGREIRNIRNISSPTVLGRPLWRGINSKSSLAVALIDQLHGAAHHVGTFAVEFKLMSLGILCKSIKKIAKSAAANCRQCYLDKIRRANPSALPKKREKMGPLDLATISDMSQGAPPVVVCGDSVGPVRLLCSCKEKNLVSVHIMVYVDVFTLRVRYHILSALNTSEIYRSLLKLISEMGPVEVILFDPSSVQKNFASTMGPIEVPAEEDMSEVLQQLCKRKGTKLWSRILYDEYCRKRLPPDVQVKLSPTNSSQIQHTAESKIKQLKLSLSSHKIFGLSVEPKYTQSDLELHLAITADTVNNLPQLSIGDQFFLSSNDLASLAGRIGMGESDYPDFLRGGGQDGPELLKAISQTVKIAAVIKSSIWALFITRMKRHQTWKMDSHRGHYTDCISRGTICVDLKAVNLSRTIHQAMGRVELVSKGRRWILLSLVVPSNIPIGLRRELFSCKTHTRVGCKECVANILKSNPTALQLVTRAIDEVYPIYSPKEDATNEVSARWHIPSFWKHSKSDFKGGLFLSTKIDASVLQKYELTLQQLEDDENSNTSG